MVQSRENEEMLMRKQRCCVLSSGPQTLGGGVEVSRWDQLQGRLEEMLCQLLEERGVQYITVAAGTMDDLRGLEAVLSLRRRGYLFILECVLPGTGYPRMGSRAEWTSRAALVECCDCRTVLQNGENLNFTRASDRYMVDHCGFVVAGPMVGKNTLSYARRSGRSVLTLE